jgi:hypothetical protein
MSAVCCYNYYTYNIYQKLSTVINLISWFRNVILVFETFTNSVKFMALTNPEGSKNEW